MVFFGPALGGAFIFQINISFLISASCKITNNGGTNANVPFFQGTLIMLYFDRKIIMAIRHLIIFVIVFLSVAGCATAATEPKSSAQGIAQNGDSDYQAYLSFFEEVYKTMQENYYHPVPPENFDKFIYFFNTRIYSQLKNEGKSRDYVKWRSSAYLVDALRSPDDIFSAFFPPTAAKDYEEEVLGKKVDLGIEGTLTPAGFKVDRIEPRSDAFDKGLREKDIILKINGLDILTLTEEQIQEHLVPFEGSRVIIDYLDDINQKANSIAVISKEYFKQTVFMKPVSVPGVYCLEVPKFNQKTAEDMTRFMSYILKQGDTSLIIDLRGNPGGPPLAAREISAFFLTPNEEFAYFQRKDKPRATLDVPEIPEPFRYKGEIVILVNEESGSASELFSGVLQGRGRATIMGTNTAGQVFLKSMFYFDDDSMVLLVTARGHHPDGQVFSFDGVLPDEKIEGEKVDLVEYAARYLASQRVKQP